MKLLYLLPLLALAGPSLAQTAAFAPVALYATGANSAPGSLNVADVNGDSKPDLLLVNAGTNTVGVLLGNGNGTFQAMVAYSTGSGSSPFGLAVADVNADGKPDLLTANNGTNTVGVLLGKGDGTFQTVVAYLTGSNSFPYNLAVADVNGDGKPDLLLVNAGSSTSGAVGVLLGNGNGTFQAVVAYPTGSSSSPWAVAVADVNGDGKPDLLVANKGTNSVGVLLGKGDGTFRAVVAYPLGTDSTPLGIAVADVNGDGRPDLLTANNGTSTAGVLLGKGDGTFQAAAFYSAGTASNPFGIAVADVNADGKPDLLTANGGSNTVGVLLGKGDGTFQTVVAFSTGSNSFPQSIAAADVNGDGQFDLLTANYKTDAVGVLLSTRPLPTRAALPGTSTALYPNPAHTSATLSATGLPAAARTVQAVLCSPLGQVVRRLTVPATLGAAQASVPTAGLAAGLYLLQLSALDAQGAMLGTLPTQRLSVAE